MKSVIISAKPKWCEKIASGKKTIEVRKTAPKKVPFKAYIYCTYGNDRENYMLGSQKKIIGEFICDKVDEYRFHDGLTEFNSMGLPSRIYGAYLIFTDDYKSMCLSYDEVKNYGKGKTLYGWHISDLKIYDKPKELSEFGQKCDNANEIRCRDCLLFKEWDNCCSVMCKPLTRPPQSWRYVEEVMERSHKECKQ